MDSRTAIVLILAIIVMFLLCVDAYQKQVLDELETLNIKLDESVDLNESVIEDLSTQLSEVQIKLADQESTMNEKHFEFIINNQEMLREVYGDLYQGENE